MIVLPCNQPVYFDVDDTLILWNPTLDQIAKDGIKCDRVITKEYLVNGETISSEETVECHFVPYHPHIKQLIQHKLRQHTVVVWSAGGERWAAQAVKLLNLEKYVDLVIAKPKWVYDDMGPEKYMPASQYIKDEES